MKDTLFNALKSSGKILLDYFDQKKESVQKESQSSIVTVADLKSDSLIREIILNQFPSHNLISEETGFSDNHSDYTWIIDPLDGTSNFVAGIPWFGVLITLFKADHPVMAGAYLPVQDTLYFAEKGKGVFKNGKKLPRLPMKELRDSLIAFCVDYTEDRDLLKRESEMYRQIVLSCRNIRATNSLIDFIFVAEGRFGGVVNLNTKVWDISGLGLMVSEAGGVMVNLDGCEINYSINDKLLLENFPVFAGSKSIWDVLKKTINHPDSP